MNADPTGAGFSPERLQAFLQTRWLGRQLRYEQIVRSTMDLARTLAHEGARDGTVVLAEEQTLGRGRLGRRWLSPRGENLYCSILLYPTMPQIRTLSMVAALAVADGISFASGLPCSLKWPNDVQVGGRKLAGILLESELSGEQPVLAIAGLGINVNLDTSRLPEIAATATSIRCERGARQDREQVLACCLDAFERWYEAPSAETRAAWRARLSTLGQRIRVAFRGGVEEGLAEDVDGDGSLLLRRVDGTVVTLAAGDVSLQA